ncbi:MAG TPA: 4Fe-4S dicluster domain-containing protein [Acidimicrobiia bacterium]|nr:4Fe-4S dicluster domain-containing protein [Acidimicrobiia bacterium]
MEVADTSQLDAATTTPAWQPQWVKVIDQTRCIGCHACTTACKSENQVPLGVTRTYVKSVDIGLFPQTRRAFQVTRCNQCSDAPCVVACPTAAMYQRFDGIVDFDKRACIGCKACIAACPYDAIFINPDDHSAEKCNFCTHRLDIGLEPACVVVCPTEAILVGDITDPTTKVASIVQRQPVTVRRPEKETHPKLFYKGAHQATLDPIAAVRPPNGLYMWSEQGSGTRSGHPGAWSNSSAAALLSYDVPHKAPWDWRVALYTWTKAIAAGGYLVALLLVLAGSLDWSSRLFVWGGPALGLVFLGLTGIVLIWDLEHPERFYYLFTRPQWRSWLVRGAILIVGYGAILALQVIAALIDSETLRIWLAVPGLPLAVMSAVYTAYLFAQSKGRDLWQSPLLPAHMAIQAVLAGAAALTVLDSLTGAEAASSLGWILAGAVLAHLLFVAGEITLPHATAHAHLAAWEMTRGRFRSWFWWGIVLTGLGLLAPWLGIWVAAPALAGLFAHEHAYIQSAQSVPLA